MERGMPEAEGRKQGGRLVAVDDACSSFAAGASYRAAGLNHPQASKGEFIDIQPHHRCAPQIKLRELIEGMGKMLRSFSKLGFPPLFPGS